MFCADFKKKKRKKVLNKSAKLILHIGFWSTVYGLILANFLYNGFFEEKIRKDNINEQLLS